MKNLFLNKRLLAVFLSLAFLTVLIAVGVFAAINGGLPGLENILASTTSEEESVKAPAEDIPEPEPEPESEPVLEQEVPEAEPVVYAMPQRMMAAVLTPGVDYFTEADMTDAEIKASIDKAIDDAVKLTANTVIFATHFGDSVLYKSSDMPQTEVSFDILNYAVARARSENLYVYAIFDVLLSNEDGKAVQSMGINRDTLGVVASNARQLAGGYDIDAVLMDNYSIKRGSDTYADYAANGNGMGYENYLRASTASAVSSAFAAIKEEDPSVQAGLAVDAVWANAETDESGSETTSGYEALVDGCTDTKKFIEDGLADFIAVKAEYSIGNKSASFGAYMQWWSELVDGKSPLYMMQYASKACSEAAGWAGPSELSDQVIAAEKLNGFSGSIFDSLAALLDNPKQSTDALILYLTENEDPSFLLTQLEMTRPTQTTYSTYEAVAVFAGASHIEFPVYLNGEEIDRDANGAFFLSLDLQPGLNTFKFEHKEKTVEYNITRNVQILKEISPKGNVAISGGMQMTVSAIAYEGSTVTATLGGQTVTLKQNTENDDATNNDSTYKQYSGTIGVPAATSADQELGNIIFKGSWSSAPPESEKGAYVTVKARSQDGDLVEVVADSAETFPTGTLDDISDYDCYPLAKGTQDYTDGDEIVYRDGDKTFSYFNLRSGQRVYSSDIKTVSASDLGGNSINGITVSANARYTKVVVSMDQPVAYIARYSVDAFTINFQYTSAVPEDISLSCTPLFDSATWSGTTLSLKLSTPAGFLGYKAYYENGDLVFRFNNPQGSGSLSGIPIVIDVGHSASKPGASGFLSAYGEYEINYAIGTKLYYELQDRGASVYMQDTESSSPDLPERVAYAKSVNPMIFISVHCNSSTKSSGNGTEGWFFNRFSAGLARRVAANVSSELGTTNRGEKIGRYYVTRVAEYPAILGEMGFLSNESDYYNLIQSSYQNGIASGIADAISAYLSAVGANGNYDYGTQSAGEASAVPEDPETSAPSSKPSSSSSSNSSSEDSSGDEGKFELPKELSMELGEVVRFSTGVSNNSLEWTSSDEEVATVNGSGKLRARGVGTAKITAVDQNGDKKTCLVTVTDGSSADSSDKIPVKP